MRAVQAFGGRWAQLEQQLILPDFWFHLKCKRYADKLNITVFDIERSVMGYEKRWESWDACGFEENEVKSISFAIDFEFLVRNLGPHLHSRFRVLQDISGGRLRQLCENERRSRSN